MIDGIGIAAGAAIEIGKDALKNFASKINGDTATNKLVNSTINPIFSAAFKKTCKNLINNKNLPIDLNEQVMDKLSSLEDITLAMIFQINEKLISEICLTNNHDNNLKSSLEKYIKSICDENIDAIFYEIFIDEFKKQLQNEFLTNNIGNEKIFRDTNIKNQSYIINTLNEMKNNQEPYNITIKIDNEKQKYLTDKNVNKKIEELYTAGNYIECIKYINKQISKQDIIKSELLSKKASCEFNLANYKTAEETYEEAFKLDSSNDKIISNLIKCYVNNKKPQKIKEIIKKYNNKTSPLFYESKVLELLHADKNTNEAEILLDKQKDNIENYNLHKANILSVKNAPYSQCIKYMRLYLKDNPNHNEVKYEMYRMMFGKIFEKSRIQFSIGIKQEDILILPAFNQNISQKEVDKLINKIENVLQNENNISKEYLLSLKIMLAILYTQKGLNEKINTYLPEIKKASSKLTNNFDRNNLCLLLLMSQEYEKAEKLYIKYLHKDNIDISLTLTINFAMKNFDKCIRIIEQNNVQANDLIKIYSLYKTKPWEEISDYFKVNFNDYNINLQLFVLDFYYEHGERDFCAEQYGKIAKAAMKNNVTITPEDVFVVASNLKHLQNTELANKLIRFYWMHNPTKNNFEIGLSYAKQLYNTQKYAKALEILSIISEDNENNEEIKELYMFIDIANNSYDSIIEKYENGYRNLKLIPNIAQAYIFKKEYDKAENAIEQIRNVTEQKSLYYQIKSVIYAQTGEYRKLLQNFQEAKQECPEDLSIDKQIIGMSMWAPKDAKMPDEFGILFRQAMKNLTEQNEIQQIKITKDDMSELVNAIQEHDEKKQNIQFIYDGYNNFKYPIELYFKAINSTNNIQIYSSMLLSKNQKINICRCEEKIIRKEIENLHKYKNVLIDIKSLILLKEIGLDFKAKGLLNLCISNDTKIELDRFLVEENGKSEHKGRISSTEDGKLQYIGEMTEYKKYVEFITEIAETYPVLSFNSVSGKGIHLIKLSEKFQTKELFNEAIIAEQNENTVACIDGIMNKVFNEDNIDTVSTISIIEYLFEKKRISYGQYFGAKLKLIQLNCRDIPLTAKEIFYALENRSYEEFEEVLKYLMVKDYSMDSLTIVSTQTIDLVCNSENIDMETKRKACQNILNSSCKLYTDFSLLSKILIMLIPHYLNYKDNIQKMFNEELAFVNITIFNGFYEGLFMILNRAKKEKPEISNNLDILIQKLRRNIPKEF